MSSHIHDAFHAKTRCHGSCCHAVHARTGFGDDALLAHAPGQQSLAHGVVDLVCTGMVEVFALEVNLRPAESIGPVFGMINRAGTPYIVLEFIGKLSLEFRVITEMQILLAQLFNRRDQRFSHEDAAVWAKMAGAIRIVVSQSC
jgi:hypothetical protein